MDQDTLLQHFHYIISLASLACTFTTLHTIQYSMRDHDNDNNITGPQDHDSINLTASSSTHDTPATTSTLENVEKTSWWTEDEVNRLLDYIKANCILTTAQGTNMKKSEFNKAQAVVKLKNVAQCHYKWGHISTLLSMRIFITYPLL
jgi:hypothetical protein